ncbi:MAG TPA: efflux RND transporter periplasmic adaptor subunit [Bacteroidota bacterium]|nr:efflux RND transporter periplasmic adaptor subunit [Bacteroidota bacterium]
MVNLPNRKGFVVATAMLLMAVMQHCGKQPAADSPPPPVVEVKTASVVRGRIDETITVSGSTAYRREAQLRSPIAGLITSFKFYTGDRLHKRDIVARVQTKESRAAIVGAEELLRSAATPGQRKEAQKALDLALKSANTVDLKAPFDGILSGKLKHEQDAVLEGDLVATMVDPSSLIFIAQVPTTSLNRIRIGQHVAMRFSAKPGKKYSGTVHQIEPQANAGDQTIPVQISFVEPTEHFEGSLFGEARITVGERTNILLVPKAAVLRNDENNTASLMVVGTDSLAHKIDVAVGLNSDSTVEVASPGLAPGSVVIIEGHYGLPDSTRVRIEN